MFMWLLSGSPLLLSLAPVGVAFATFFGLRDLKNEAPGGPSKKDRFLSDFGTLRCGSNIVNTIKN